MLTKENIVAIILDNFPLFKEKMQYSSENKLLQYLIVGDLVCEFIDDYQAGKLTEAEIQKFFDFANRMSESQDGEVENMLIVMTLETITNYKDVQDLAMRYLNKKGISLLKRVIAGWPQEWDDEK